MALVRALAFSLALAVPATLASPGTCVVTHCAVPLAKCELDTVCRKWQSCVTGCGLTNASLPCQIRCADVYQPTDDTAAAIHAFSECAISENHCVPQTGKASDCPAPASNASLPDFEMGAFTNGTDGVWYITRGHNPLFDCFDCQKHTFSLVPTDPTGKVLHGDLGYLVKEDLNCIAPDCNYLPRLVRQSWNQDQALPAHLINHNNTIEEMHYADDWYVLAHDPNRYILVYYCGCNDASCGYGGAVLYTRSPSGDFLTDQDRQVLERSLVDANVGFTFSSMCTPSNLACS